MIPRIWLSASGAGLLSTSVVFAQIPIASIQGSSAESPLAGQTVTTRGIVTAKKSNGFFLQTPGTGDGDAATSDGVFVFTFSVGSVQVGDEISMTGTVQEYRPTNDPSSPPVTELTSPTGITVLNTDQPLPEPVEITALDASTVQPLDPQRFERFEGMRVRIGSLTVTAPTGAATFSEVNSAVTSDGLFQGVITGMDRPFREPGIEVPTPLPSGAPTTVTRFDANPERLAVDSDGQLGAAAVDVAADAIATNLTGVLDYVFRTYTLLLDPSAAWNVTGHGAFRAVPAGHANELTVASANLERFYDAVSPNLVLSAEAYDRRLGKASRLIRHVLRNPDIVAVQEVENLTVLQTLAARIDSDASAAGEPAPQYTAYSENGPDSVDLGFLVRSARVALSSVAAQPAGLLQNPNGTTSSPLFDRPTYVLTATGPNGLAFTLINNHLLSLTRVAEETPGPNGWPTDGARARGKRLQQAESLGALIKSRLAANPAERLLAVGDFNAHPFNDGYVDVVGILSGQQAPAPQVTLWSSFVQSPLLQVLTASSFAPASERYSYIFGGHAQQLDHALASPALSPLVTRLAHGRVNADFPEIYRNDGTRPERLSDHDPLLVAIDASPWAVWRSNHFGVQAGNAAVAGELANPSGDGIANLLKYAFGLDPSVPNTNGLPSATIVQNAGQRFLEIAVTKSATATDLTIVAEVSSDLANWQTAASGAVVVIENTATRLVARDATPLGSVGKRFMRVRVSKP